MSVSQKDISFESEPDSLVVRAHTRYIVMDKQAAFAAIAAAIAAQPVKVALIDLREVPGPFTFLDRVWLGEATSQHLVGTPIAAILTEEQLDPERIGRLVAQNRCANVEIFGNETEARAWLQRYLTSAG